MKRIIEEMDVLMFFAARLQFVDAKHEAVYRDQYYGSIVLARTTRAQQFSEGFVFLIRMVLYTKTPSKSKLRKLQNSV